MAPPELIRPFMAAQRTTRLYFDRGNNPVAAETLYHLSIHRSARRGQFTQKRRTHYCAFSLSVFIFIAKHLS